MVKAVQILFWVASFISLLQSYEVEESGVLMLYESDFPKILEDFPHILIEFYAPQSEFCKRLYPIYNNAAQLLAKKRSTSNFSHQYSYFGKS